MDAKTNSTSATLTVGNKTYDFPILSGTVGPDVLDISKLYAQAGLFTYDPGFTSTASCQSKITYIDGDAGILQYRGYPIEQLGATGRLPRDLLPVVVRRIADQVPEGRLRLSRHAPQHGARADGAVLPGLPPRRASDGGHGCLGRRDGGVLPRLHRHQRSDPADGRFDPDDRQGADAGGDGLQIFGRPALRVSEELALLCRELPADVLRDAVRGLRRQSGAGAGAGQDLHPARRSRAERLDLDGPHRRLLGRQPVRLYRGGHRLPVGSGAWRRQRSRIGDARRNRPRRKHSRIHQEGEGQELVGAADGLRPPRLQELRSARQDHAGHLPRGAGGNRPSRRPAA